MATDAGVKVNDQAQLLGRGGFGKGCHLLLPPFCGMYVLVSADTSNGSPRSKFIAAGGVSLWESVDKTSYIEITHGQNLLRVAIEEKALATALSWASGSGSGIEK